MPFQTHELDTTYRFSLDLNSYVVKNPSSTFFVKVEGSAMTESGISSGDILVVDRSVNPSDNSLVLSVIDGDFVLKHFPLPIKPSNSDSDCYVWGVVIAIVRKL